MNKVKQYIQRAGEWRNVKVFPSNKYIAGCHVWIFIVPVVAKIMSKINDELVFVFHEQIIRIDTALPFSWKLFFLGAISICIGNILFAILCPPIVKTYSTFEEFVSGGGDGKELGKYRRMEENTHDNVLVGAKKERDKHEGNERDPDEYVKESFWKYYKSENVSNKCGIYLTYIFYFIGLLLFVWVMLSNVMWVFNSGHII